MANHRVELLKVVFITNNFDNKKIRPLTFDTLHRLSSTVGTPVE